MEEDASSYFCRVSNDNNPQIYVISRTIVLVYCSESFTPIQMFKYIMMSGRWLFGMLVFGIFDEGLLTCSKFWVAKHSYCLIVFLCSFLYSFV